MGLITPDMGLLFWMLVTFFIVIYLLKKFAWKPILESLKEREDTIEDALKSAEDARNEMAKLKADNAVILQEAKAEREEMLKDAREVKNKIIADAKKEAGAEAEKMIEAAKLQIQSEKASALKSIKEEVVGISIEIAEKVIRENLKDDKTQNKFAQKLLNEIQPNKA